MSDTRTGRALNLLSEKELSEQLHVSTWALRRFRTRRDADDPLPFVMAGRRVLYHVSDVEAWLTREARRAKEAQP
ncbi:MAG: DNA-binding protein [Planctomycetota bacterium]